MKRGSAGSCIVMFVLMLSALLLFLSGVWKTSIYFTDVSLQRQTYEQQFWVTQGALSWAIVYAKTNFDQIKQTLQFQNEVSGKLSIGNSGQSMLLSIVNDKKSSLLLTASNPKKCTLACQLERIDTENEKQASHFVIKNWHRVSL